MFFHGGNAIGFVVCNKTFVAPHAQGQTFMATNLIMVNCASHYFDGTEIYGLVVVTLKNAHDNESWL
jgi:hypothetical protein